MRCAAKADDNKKEIVKAFRQLGWIVAHKHTIGKGMPDIIVSRLFPSNHKFTAVIEIKDGNKYKSEQKLTVDEEIWHKAWQGELAIINSVDAVLEYHNQVMQDFG